MMPKQPQKNSCKTDFLYATSSLDGSGDEKVSTTRTLQNKERDGILNYLRSQETRQFTLLSLDSSVLK